MLINFKVIFNLSFQCRKFATAAAERIVSDLKVLKPNINIGTIGHVDHGKTTLTAAITKFLSKKNPKIKFVQFDEIDKAKEEKKRGITINIAHIGYETEKRRYAHTDCPGHKDFIKNMICGTAQMDAAVLVIAATDGVMVQTREHLLLARQLGVKNIIVFINKADVVENDDLELVEIEARELLNEFGFNGNVAKVIKGSALQALSTDNFTPLEELLDAMDNLPIPQRSQDASFLMPISSSVSITGRGTVIVGTIETGILKKGDMIEIKGFDADHKTVVTDIQVFKESLKQVVAGDHCGILCKRLHSDHVKKGMWAGSINSIQTTNIVKVKLYLLDESEGGRQTGIRSNFTDHVFCSTWEQSGRIAFEQELLMPGEHTDGFLVFVKNVPIKKNMPFTIREGRSRTIAKGLITELCKPIFIDSFEKMEVKDVKELLKNVEILEKKI